MTESAAVQLRALRAAIAGGQVEAVLWENAVHFGTPLWWRLLRALHSDSDGWRICQCHDRDHVLAGLDRLIAEIEAQEAQHAGE